MIVILNILFFISWACGALSIASFDEFIKKNEKYRNYKFEKSKLLSLSLPWFYTFNNDFKEDKEFSKHRNRARLSIFCFFFFGILIIIFGDY